MSKLYDILNSMITRLKKVETNGADWNASEGEAGHVKNRTHYEETTVVNEPLNITWDGNTEGLVSAKEYGGDWGYEGWYKVSDAVLTNDEIKSSTISWYETLFDENSNPVVEESVIQIEQEWDFMVAVGMVTDEKVDCQKVVFVKSATDEFPETGIYFWKCYDADRNVDSHATSLTTTEPVEHTKTVVHKLDKKFLPDDVGGGGGAGATHFYCDDTYLYWDRDLTTKVTSDEFMKAYQGIIRVGDDGFTYSPFYFNLANEYKSLVYRDVSNEDHQGYTAEYVDMGPPV